MSFDCPHYGLVPKELEANLRFRKDMLEGGAGPGGCGADPHHVRRRPAVLREHVLLDVRPAVADPGDPAGQAGQDIDQRAADVARAEDDNVKVVW